MTSIINLIKPAFENENYPWIVLILSLTIFFKANVIFKFIDNLKKNKLNFLFDLEKKSFLDDSTKESIQEAINNDIFKATTGIQTNKYMREKIMILYKEKKGEITLYAIKNAMTYLKINNNSLLVELRKQDKAWCLFNLLFGFITLCLGIILMMIVPTIADSSIQERLTSFIMGVGFIFITFPILAEVRAYKSAKK